MGIYSAKQFSQKLSDAIAKKDYTIVIHGKPKHEETRATFSHASHNAPSVVVENMEEARQLADYITGKKTKCCSPEVNPHTLGNHACIITLISPLLTAELHRHMCIATLSKYDA